MSTKTPEPCARENVQHAIVSRREILGGAAGLVAHGALASAALTSACGASGNEETAEGEIAVTRRVPPIVPDGAATTYVTLNGAKVPFSLALLAGLPKEKQGLVFLEALRQNKDPRALHGLFEECRRATPPVQKFTNIPFEPSAGIGRTFPDGNAYEVWLKRPPAERPLVNISTLADVREVLTKTEIFTTSIEELRFTRLDNHVILGMKDTPQYRRELAAMRFAVRPTDIATIKDIVRRACSAFLDKAAGTIDIVEYAALAPLSYNVDYFGFADGEGFGRADISRWGLILNEDIFFNLSDNANIRGPADVAAREMKAYLSALMRRTKPSMETPVSRLLLAQENDPAIDDDAVRRMLGAFVIGSHLTTMMAITNIVAELLDQGSEVFDGARAAARRDDDDLVAKYCWEAARFRPIGHSLYRVCELGAGETYALPSGATVEGGAVVFVPTLSAGLDGGAVPEPYHFRLDRPRDLNLLFCTGRHTCFGAQISMAAIPEAVKQLLKRNLPVAGNQGRLEFFANEPRENNPNVNRFPPKSLKLAIG